MCHFCLQVLSKGQCMQCWSQRNESAEDSGNTCSTFPALGSMDVTGIITDKAAAALQAASSLDSRPKQADTIQEVPVAKIAITGKAQTQIVIPL